MLQLAETQTDIRVYKDRLRTTAMCDHSFAPSVGRAYSPLARPLVRGDPLVEPSALRPNH